MSEAFLKLDKIVKSFPGVKAIRGISLEVGKGEIHALLGENERQHKLARPNWSGYKPI